MAQRAQHEHEHRVGNNVVHDSPSFWCHLVPRVLAEGQGRGTESGGGMGSAVGNSKGVRQWLVATSIYPRAACQPEEKGE